MKGSEPWSLYCIILSCELALSWQFLYSFKTQTEFVSILPSQTAIPSFFLKNQSHNTNQKQNRNSKISKKNKIQQLKQTTISKTKKNRATRNERNVPSTSVPKIYRRSMKCHKYLHFRSSLMDASLYLTQLG